MSLPARRLRNFTRQFVSLQRRQMATPSKVHLDVSESPEYHRPGITQESAKKASELLQENHEIHRW